MRAAIRVAMVATEKIEKAGTQTANLVGGLAISMGAPTDAGL